MFVICLMPEEENKTTEEELIAVRREKLSRLRELGVDPFGGKYDVESDITTPARGLMKAREQGSLGESLLTEIWARVTSLMSLIFVVEFSAI